MTNSPLRRLCRLHLYQCSGYTPSGLCKMASMLPLSALCVAHSARACVPGGGAEKEEEEEEEASGKAPICVYIHTYTHTHIHTYIDVHTHTRTPTHTHTHKASGGAHTPEDTEAGGEGGGVGNGWGGGGSAASSTWVGRVSVPIVGGEEVGGVPGGGGVAQTRTAAREWIQGLKHWVTVQRPPCALQGGQGGGGGGSEALMLTELSLINLPVGEDSLAALLLSSRTITR